MSEGAPKKRMSPEEADELIQPVEDWIDHLSERDDVEGLQAATQAYQYVLDHLDSETMKEIISVGPEFHQRYDSLLMDSLSISFEAYEKLIELYVGEDAKNPMDFGSKRFATEMAEEALELLNETQTHGVFSESDVNEWESYFADVLEENEP